MQITSTRSCLTWLHIEGIITDGKWKRCKCEGHQEIYVGQTHGTYHLLLNEFIHESNEYTHFYSKMIFIFDRNMTKGYEVLYG